MMIPEIKRFRKNQEKEYDRIITLIVEKFEIKLKTTPFSIKYNEYLREVNKHRIGRPPK